MGQVEPRLSAIEFGAAGQLDAAGSQDVPPPIEIYVVGLSCIVVSVELAEVLQLPEAHAIFVLNTGGESRHDAVSLAGVARAAA